MRRVMWLAGLCCLMALGLMLWGFAAQERPPQRQSGHCLLLVEQDTGSELLQLRRGLEAALSRQGRLSLRVERLADTNWAQPPQWVKDARVVYLQAEDPQAPLSALKALGKAVILLGRQLPGESSVTADALAGGQALALHLMAQNKPGRLLLIGDEAEPGQQLRAQGLMNGLKGWAVEWYSLEQLGRGAVGAQGVVALSGDSLWRVASLKRAGAFSAPLYGFDAVDSRVQLMEEGLLQAVVASNFYAVGYSAGQMLSPRAVQQNKVAPKLVAAEGLYLAENAQLMFPLLP